MKKQVVVVGGGVSGLACGLKLLEAGYAVQLLARELSPHTTSDVAAAFWYPDGAEPAARVRRWAAASHQEFRRLMQVPGSGVSWKKLVELAPKPFAPLDWFEMVAGYETAVYPPNLHGYRVTVPAIDTPIYMPYLLRQFEENGGLVEQRSVDRLTDLLSDFPLVVNCTGVWARHLAEDTAVYPIRGQIICVKKPAGLPDEIVHMDDVEYSTYIVPRSRDCVLGGCKQQGDWRLTIDQELVRDILARCTAVQPLLEGAEILGHRVGLRPGRIEVRLELEEMAGGTAVIHNYGHGSIGHTLAWGCATEVVSLAHSFFG